MVVLAIELVPAGPTTAIPTFSPAGGTYSAAQTVMLSDATSGATIYYTTNGTTPTTASTVYSAPLTVSATTTIQALAGSSGAASSAVASAIYTIVLPGSVVSVPFATVANLYGIGNNGTAVPGTGIDGSGHTYSETLIGASATWSGVPFSFGGADALDAVANTMVPLPAGNFSKVYLLATGLNGNQANQTFVFTYTDGTTSTAVQSLMEVFVTVVDPQFRPDQPGAAMLKTSRPGAPIAICPSNYSRPVTCSRSQPKSEPEASEPEA